MTDMTPLEYDLRAALHSAMGEVDELKKDNDEKDAEIERLKQWIVDIKALWEEMNQREQEQRVAIAQIKQLIDSLPTKEKSDD